MRDGREAVLLCGPDIRRPLRALTRRSIPKLSVLSISEIPLNIELRSHGIVKLEASTAPARGPNTLSGPLPGRGDHVLGTADVQLQ